MLRMHAPMVHLWCILAGADGFPGLSRHMLQHASYVPVVVDAAADDLEGAPILEELVAPDTEPSRIGSRCGMHRVCTRYWGCFGAQRARVACVAQEQGQGHHQKLRIVTRHCSGHYALVSSC